MTPPARTVAVRGRSAAVRTAARRVQPSARGRRRLADTWSGGLRPGRSESTVSTGWRSR